MTEREDLQQRFLPREGYNTCYYGKVRNGKTYSATCDILELLERGEQVISNWDINFDYFDQSDDNRYLMAKLFSNDPYVFKFNRGNFEYIKGLDHDHLPYLNRLVGVHIFIDEGQWIFNSHSRSDNVHARRLILEGGHHCRTLNVITQRPENILKDIRSQVHVWHEVQKVFHHGYIVRFVRYTTEEMKDTLPIQFKEVEDYKGKRVLKATGTQKGYWGRDKIFKAYSTYSMRSEDSILKDNDFDYAKLTKREIISTLTANLFRLNRNR